MIPRQRRIFSILVCLAMLSGTVTRVFAEEKPQRAFLEVTINGTDIGNVLVVLRPDDVLVHLSELREAGLDVPSSAQVEVAADTFVSLRALGVATRYVLDTNALTLKFSVLPGLFHARRIAIGADPTAMKPSPSTNGAFLNYAVTGTTLGPLEISGQLRVSALKGAFQTSLNRNALSGRIQAQNTNYTRDDFAHAVRYVAGASSLDLGDFAGLGGVVGFDGISVQRMLSMNPNLIRRTAGGVSGVALNASTVDVYVNGALIQHQQVAAGPFQLTNIPLQDGVNTTSVVIRDAFGNQQTVNRAGYLGADMLSRGVSQYEFGLGRESDGAALGGVAAGRYDLGVTDALTISARALGSPALRNAGMTMSFALPIGELSLAGALSDARTTGTLQTALASRETGAAYGIEFSRAVRRFSVGASLTRQSAYYTAAPASSPSDDRQLLAKHAYAQLALGTGGTSISLQANAAKYRDSASTSETIVTFSTPLGRSTGVSIGAGRGTVGTTSGPTWSARIDSVLGRAVRTSYSSGVVNGIASQQYELAHDDPHPLGVSYRALVGTSDGQTLRDLNYVDRTAFGTLTFDASNQGPSSSATLTMSGAISFVGGGWYLSAPIRDGFAVLDLDGIAGVGATLNGDPVGRTNRQGRILVPNLSSYANSTVGIEATDLPSDTLLENVTADVVPAYHSGSIVHFGARRVRAVTGHLRFTGLPVRTPEYGQMIVATPGGDLTVDIGTNGLLYFDQLKAGAYEARVRSAMGACTTRIVVPPTSNSVTDLGTLLCERGIP